MSFIDTQAGVATRAKTIAVVGGVHVLIAGGLVAGLTVSAYISEDNHLPTVIYKDALPPPPAPEIIEQTDEAVSYVPPVAPDRKLDLAPDRAIIVDPIRPDVADEVVQFIPEPRVTPTIAPTSPPTSPRFTPAGPQPRNRPAGWISNSDYPSSPLRRGEEGTANYRLVVGSDGRVNACEINISTGFTALDRATCRLLERRARFDPATNGKGEKVVGTYSGSVSWQIPD